MTMAFNDARSLPVTRDMYEEIPTLREFDAEFQSRTDTKWFKGSHLKGFHNALFVGDSLWICGWNKNIIGQKYIVCLNVQGDDYGVLSKKKNKYHEADEPMIMFAIREMIYFAKRSGYEIHSFNTKTQVFHSVFHSKHVAISAMCGSEDFLYILDKNQPSHVHILDYNFNDLDRIKTGLENIHDCNVGMCSTDNVIVVSISFPLGSVRLLEQTLGVAWNVNIRNCPELPMRFDPCSVSAILGSCILFSDRSSDKVSKSSTNYDTKYSLILGYRNMVAFSSIHKKRRHP